MPASPAWRYPSLPRQDRPVASPFSLKVSLSPPRRAHLVDGANPGWIYRRERSPVPGTCVPCPEAFSFATRRASLRISRNRASTGLSRRPKLSFLISLPARITAARSVPPDKLPDLGSVRRYCSVIAAQTAGSICDRDALPKPTAVFLSEPKIGTPFRAQQALPHGHSGQGFPIHFGRCQRSS